MNSEVLQILILIAQAVVIPLGFKLVAAVGDIRERVTRMEAEMKGGAANISRLEVELARVREDMANAEKRLTRIEAELGVKN